MADWKIEREGDVAIVSLDDGKANALLVPEFQGLEKTLDEVEKAGALSVVLTGRPGFFSAGLNLKVLGTMNLDQKKELVAAMGSAVLKLFTFSRPVVAAVSGHALGGGAMLALASDIRIIADGAFRFGLNEVQVGLFVPSYAIELARSAISASRLTDLVMHGRVVTPMEALNMHIAEAVHSPEALRTAAMMRARELAKLAGTGYSITKKLVRGPSAELARAKIPGELETLASMLG
ncbi:MAG: enoyl-CoA hydratase/isomerase family protein [Archangium sp.]|nr:enoyl-CoA hydratase/isomerase family protein [Archangium sp.]